MEAQKNSKKEVRAKQKWPPVRKHIVNGTMYWVLDFGKVNGKRKRQVFKTKSEADLEADKARIAKKNEGVLAFSLSPEIRSEAARCIKDLKPYGVTLTDTVKYYIKHVIAFRDAPQVKEIVARLIDEARSAKRREKTIVDLSYRLEKFARSFGDRKLTSIALPELEDWIADPELSARSRINFAVKISQLYNFAIRKGWAEVNLVQRISRPDAEDGEPEIFTVEETATLLNRAPKFRLLPFIALGFFAGIRRAELERLDWSAIKFTERAVIIGSHVAKKRSRRVVEINYTLAFWLAPYIQKTGLVVDPENLRKRLDELHQTQADEGKGSKIIPKKNNGLRHSFGSYHLSMYGDAVKTATQMGHQDVAVLHNHYKALVLKSEAERFWGLSPVPEGVVIIPMRAKA
jgi:integrase